MPNPLCSRRVNNKKLLTLKGKFLTSKITSESAGITEGKQYKVITMTPMYGGNFQVQPTSESQGPLCYIEVTTETDGKNTQKIVPIYNFIEAAETILKRRRA